MKLLTATVIAMALATPALANKEYIGKPDTVKPAMSECAVQVENLQTQIIRMKKEMAALRAAQPSKKPMISEIKPIQKPVSQLKKG